MVSSEYNWYQWYNILRYYSTVSHVHLKIEIDNEEECLCWSSVKKFPIVRINKWKDS